MLTPACTIRQLGKLVILASLSCALGPTTACAKNTGTVDQADPSGIIARLEPSAMDGDAAAQYQLGMAYQKSGEHEKARDWLQRAADKGNADAQYELAMIYFEGRHTYIDYEKALPLLEKAAAQQHPMAMYKMGWVYEYGRGRYIDLERAKEWYQKAALAGVPEAKTRIAEFLIIEGTDANNDKAVDLLESAADQGSVNAIMRLAQHYDNLGPDITAREKAVQLYTAAAKAGVPEAMARLAEIYTSDIVITADPQKAFEWSKKAAEKGMARAQFYLGRMYETGDGVEQNDDLAFEWYKKAAEQKHIDAMARLALFYLEGISTAPSYSRAYELARAAIDDDNLDQADTIGLYVLGMLYLDGHHAPTDAENPKELGVKYLTAAAESGNINAAYRLGIYFNDTAKDPTSAAEWLESAALKGFVAAQYRIANMYLTGSGVEKNDRRAFRWFRRAARQNDPRAQIQLGVMYKDGIGAGPDIKAAWQWFTIAAENDSAPDIKKQAEKQLAQLEKSMPPEQIAEAKSGLPKIKERITQPAF